MYEQLAPSEQVMWEKPVSIQRVRTTDDEINSKYGKRELRIVTESNREQLPNFVEAFKRPNWMNLRPFYQRRPRWDAVRQSKLIESFIMNIPVPPLFVFESDLAKYEVMDGQQRITAILDFYTNRLRLKGLEQWPELNGRIYDNLPTEIRKGIDRRSISYIVLLKESASSTEEEMLLRQQVFERLNTGGVALGAQEIRNSIYQSKFNSLLAEIAKNNTFRTIWQIPPYSESEETHISEDLLKNRMYTRMEDIEIALRFFALRHAEQYKGGMKRFLNLYMIRARAFNETDIEFLRDLFIRTITLAHGLFGEHTFRAYDPDEHSWFSRPQVAFADAVMVACSKHLDWANFLLGHREVVIERTKELFVQYPAGTFTGQRNTKKDVEDRIELFDKMLSEIVGQ